MNKNKEKGFTLIELLIVITLFGMMFAGATGVFSMMIKNKERVDEILDIRRQVGDSLAVINREIVNARGINFDGDWGSCDDGVNDIEIRNVEGQEIELGLSGGNIIAGDRVLLNRADIDINEVEFICEQSSTNGRYGLEFYITIDNNGVSETFRTFAVVRNEIY